VHCPGFPGFHPQIVLAGYDGPVLQLPPEYVARRQVLGFDEVSLGAGGIHLAEISELEATQLGYALDAEGNSLVGNEPGEWQKDWIVIGYETACGDPIFLSTDLPNAVYSAMHGQGSWSADLVAPSLNAFFQCVEAFRKFAAGRDNPVLAEATPPSDEEIEAYLQNVLSACNGNPATVVPWAMWAGIDLS
jgi:hypothetical protein